MAAPRSAGAAVGVVGAVTTGEPPDAPLLGPVSRCGLFKVPQIPPDVADAMPELTRLLAERARIMDRARAVSVESQQLATRGHSEARAKDQRAAVAAIRAGEKATGTPAEDAVQKAIRALARERAQLGAARTAVEREALAAVGQHAETWTAAVREAMTAKAAERADLTEALSGLDRDLVALDRLTQWLGGRSGWAVDDTDDEDGDDDA